jgi:hypothetical protein
MSSQTTFDKLRFESFMKSRKTINDSHVGQLIQAKVVGNGNIVTVKGKDGKPVMGSDGQPLQKRIYNLNLNSAIAMANTRTREKALAANKAFAAGNKQEASDIFSDILNDLQVSFDVWANSSQNFMNGQIVQGVVEKVTTKKGSLLKLNSVSAVQAQQASATTVDSLEALLSFGETPTDGGTDGAGSEDAAKILAGTGQ